MANPRVAANVPQNTAATVEPKRRKKILAATRAQVVKILSVLQQESKQALRGHSVVAMPGAFLDEK